MSSTDNNTENTPATPSCQQVDLIIIGAGPAGLSLARCLKDSDLRIALVDKLHRDSISAPAFDGRDIAMTHMSRAILQRIGVWQRFAPEHVHPLNEAKVINGHSPYALHFERSDGQTGPLGYLVANHRIRCALYQAVAEQDNVQWLLEQEVASVSSDQLHSCVTLSNGQQLVAPLCVSADSRFSATRRMMGIGARMTDYGRVMIVCNMKHRLSHQHTAQEAFYYGRTCAILPLGECESSIVITVPASESQRLCEQSETQFNREVEKFLQHKLGAMELTSPRMPYPLVGAFADRFIGTRYALVGDAAVGMHPVTAHGYNLGLRSADTLAEQVINAHRNGRDIGSHRVLHAYQARHMLLARPLYDYTNQIVRLFTNDSPLAKLARGAALHIANHLPPFKKLVSQRLTQLPRGQAY